jgi:hypothetical protein
MNETTFWSNPENGLTTTQTKSVPALRERMRASGLEIARSLAVGLTDNLIDCTPADMQLLCRWIQADAVSNAVALDRLQIVAKIVAHVNAVRDSKIPNPTISNLLTRPANPYRKSEHGIVWALRCYRALCEMESRWLIDRQGSPSIEMILLSGILHGGLWHPSLVLCVASVLISPEGKLGHVGDYVYVDVNLPWRGKPSMERRLWFLDRQTACLIGRSDDCGSEPRTAANQRWRSVPQEDLGDVIWRSMRKSMRGYDLPGESLPKSLKGLVETVELAAGKDLPPIIAGFGARKFVAHSLKPESLDRLRGTAINEPADVPEFPEDDSNGKLPDLQLSAIDDERRELEPRGFVPLRAAFSSKNESEVREGLEKIVSTTIDSPTAVTRFAQFALYLMTERHVRPGSFRRKKPQLATVREYTTSLVRRLGCLLDGGDTDPSSDLSSDDREAKYLEALEGACTGKNPRTTKNSVARLLREFDDFLVFMFGIEPISPDVLGTEGGLVPVDATITRVEDYYEARRYVREDLRDYPAPVLRAVEAQLVIEYRCGTRRMEGIGLEANDIVDDGPEWIFIRPNEHRGIKTARSLRQSPVFALCSDEEISVIAAWKDDLAGGTRYSQNVLMPIVLKALGHATGMSHPRAHQNRHAWASLNFLRLMLSELKEIPDIFPNSPQTMAFLREPFGDALYGHSNTVVDQTGSDVERIPTRKHAYAIASLAGHSLTEISCEHYLHFFDLLLNLFLAESETARVTTRQFSVAAGCSERSAYSASARSIPLHLWQKKFHTLLGDELPEGQDIQPTNDGAPKRPYWLPAHNVLLDCEQPGATIEGIAEKNRMELQLVRFIVENSIQVGRIRELHHQTVRHAMQNVLDPSGNLPFLHLVPRPPRPRSAKERYVISALQAQVEAAVQSGLSVAREVLGYFVNNTWLTEDVLLFRDTDDPEPARRHMRFLYSCDLKLEQIRFVSYDTSEEFIWGHEWARLLGVPKEQLVVRAPPYGNSEASAKWLAIETNISGIPVPGRNSVPGSGGFRFLMTMAAIVFGFNDG